MRKTLLAASALALALAAPLAHAHQAGDIIVRAGVVTVDPQEDNGKLKVDGVPQPGPNEVGLNSNTQLGLNFAYMLNDQLGVELLAATPFTHEVKLNGAKLGDVTHLPPTLSAVYYPLGGSAAFQPYVGAGLNVTVFFDEKVGSAAKSTYKSMSLDSSVGLAFQIGADYMLNDKLMVNAQVRYIDIATEATVKTHAGNKATVDVDVDPLVYMVGLGYKF